MKAKIYVGAKKYALYIRRKIIPDGYTQLEYLGSDSKAYIDTGIAGGKNTLEVYCKFSYSNFVAYGGIYGNYISDSHNGTRCILGDVNNEIITNNNTICTTVGNTVSSCNIDIVHTIICNNNEIMLDDNVTLIENKIQGTLNNNSIAIFNRSATNPNTTRNIGAKIYEFSIKDNGVLVSNLIPAKRNSDNVLGMYDLVSNAFLTNAGTGTFIGGEL